MLYFLPSKMIVVLHFTSSIIYKTGFIADKYPVHNFKNEKKHESAASVY